MRVLVAGIYHETHTFLDGRTGLEDFLIRRGNEMLTTEGDDSPLGGFLEFARQHNWDVVPLADYRATPGPTVTDSVLDSFWKDIETRALPALQQGIDTIFLVLHGAMVCESYVDVEGEVLERIRRLPGAASLPLFGVFDLHANVSPRMMSLSNGLVAYRENPHTDARESAQRAAALMARAWERKELPRMRFARAPIVWPPPGTGTANDPMRALEAAARKIESASAKVWAVNIAAGFSFADTPDTGVSVSIVTTGNDDEADRQLQTLVELAWSMRQTGNVTEPPLADAMDQLVKNQPGLTLLIEPSDNIGGGAPGNSTWVLRALVERQIANAAVAIYDPASVSRAAPLPLGSRVALDIGGTGNPFSPPLPLEVEVISRSSGRFKLEDPHSHLASMCGGSYEMGPCAVVRRDGITILLTSRRTPPFDLGQWRSQGIEPAQLSVIGVKAAVAHRRAYDPITARSYYVDTPGPCSSNLRTFPYKRIRRPIFPLDEFDLASAGAVGSNC
jgi:microcystin degradation protein MlrC